MFKIFDFLDTATLVNIESVSIGFFRELGVWSLLRRSTHSLEYLREPIALARSARPCDNLHYDRPN